MNNNKNKRQERLGQKRRNNQGLIMEIVEYYNTDHIVVRFDGIPNYRKVTRWREFNKGQVAVDKDVLQKHLSKTTYQIKRDVRFGCATVTLAIITLTALGIFGLLKLL